jgi:alpha-1,3-rhamnosyl/mannosyltransferase
VFRFPETHPIERVAAFERVFADSLRRAAHVITDSKTVRQELIADFGVSPADVTSVPLGVDSTYAPRTSDECRVPLERWGLSRGKYGLCVSTLEPRKGISRLLRAWRALPPDLRRQYPLVMAGGVGWRNENLLEEVRIAEREGWAQHLGYVEESELPCLFAGARVFAYPSTYEGFGLPPLEAMASGVPVIVSNRSCMPEVSGDAALLIDPDHTVEFSQALQKALIDREWRDEAIARGLSRASDFTWSRCVNETVEVYERLKANG